MANYLVSIIFQRVILPLVLATSIVLRPVGFSFIYLGFIFALPRLPICEDLISKPFSIFFTLLISSSSIIVTLHGIFQLIWNFNESLLENKEIFLRNVGFINFINEEAIEIIWWMLPDMSVLLTALIFFPLLKKMGRKRKNEQPTAFRSVRVTLGLSASWIKRIQGFDESFYNRMKIIGNFSSLAALCFAGACSPSAINFLYFIAFLLSVTYVASNRNLSSKFTKMLRLLSHVILLHLTAILAYQNSWLHEIVNGDKVAKLLGIKRILMIKSGKNFQNFQLNQELSIDQILHPCALLSCYFIIIYTTSYNERNAKVLELYRQRKRRRSYRIISRDEKSYDTHSKSEFSEMPGEEKPITAFKKFCNAVRIGIEENLYLMTIFSMMCYSIIFHSPFSFVFLLTSNIIWLLPNHHGKTIRISDFLVGYSIFVLIFNYFCDLELENSTHATLSKIGSKLFRETPFLHLVLKVILMCPFWATMRQKYGLKNEILRYLKFERRHSFKESFMKLSSKWMKNGKRFAAYVWIISTISFLFLITYIGDQMSLFRIINMVFVLVFLLTFQVSFQKWKKFLNTFFFALIIHSKLFLTAIYIYQFNYMPNWSYYEFLGLYKYSITKLFFKLFSLMILSVMSGIYLKYFHHEVLRSLHPSFLANNEDEDDVVEKRGKWFEWISSKLKKLQEKLLIFLEIHFHKIIFTITFYYSTQNMSFSNIVGMLLLLIATKSKSSHVRDSILKIICFLISFYLIGLMIFELTDQFLNIIPEEILETPIYSIIIILGLNIDELLPKMIFFGVVTIYFAMKARRGEKSVPQCIFKDISRIDADESLLKFVKFLFNYGFYKFGVEVILMIMVLLICTKLDLFTIAYIPIFLKFAFKRQQTLKLTCKFSSSYVFLLILIQMAALTRFRLIELAENDVMEKWEIYVEEIFLDLKFFPTKLTYDFVLLLMLTSLSIVFKTAKKTDFSDNPFKNGGENDSVFSSKISDAIFKHPIYSFNEKITSFMELSKRYVFKIQYWVTIAIVFFVGSHRIDVFSLCYIFCSFVFLWKGTDFYLKPLPSLIRHWNGLLLYNILAIMLKVIIKGVGCTYGETIPGKYCFLLAIFDVPCASSDPEERYSIYCENYEENTVFMWDILCFFFIIMQRRIFLSHYFFNVVQDIKITNMMSMRGAKLTEELRFQDMNKSFEAENAYLENLRLRMEKIRKIASIHKKKRIAIKSHEMAVLSGDAYMFADDFEETPQNEIVQKSTAIIPKNNDNISDAFFDIEISSENENEDQEIRNENPVKKTIGRSSKAILKFLQAIFNKLHQHSKHHTYIIKLLHQEKKYLRQAYSERSQHSSMQGEESSSSQKRNTSINLPEEDIDSSIEDFIGHKRKSQAKLSDVETQAGKITFVDFSREMFYFALTHTNLVVYLVIFINQIVSANILSLPLPLLVFIWGSLTFPRPSKFFWIFCIAYTKTIIVIKSLAQLKFVWWNRDHLLLQYFGLNADKNYAIYDLVLLLTLFLHRAVLKIFGFWKDEDVLSFDEGTFELDRCDSATKALIKFLLKNAAPKPRTSSLIKENEIKAEENESNDLLVEDELLDSKIVLRHVYKSEQMNVEIHPIFEARKKMIKAREELFTDNEGRKALKLRQDDVKLRLRPINMFETDKKYPAQRVVTVESVIEEPIDFYPLILCMSFNKYISLTSTYLKGLFSKFRNPRKPVDTYTLMFFFEFVNFFVLIFGFSTFVIEPSVDESRTILTYFEENRVPTSLLFLVVIQFAVIIIDRMLYLRKFMVGKILFHFCIIVTTHIWMFFIIPINSSRSFNSTIPPVLYYFFKCIYLLISAYQIRCGYPSRVLGNFIMRKFDRLHAIAFKAYLYVPFLYELRSSIDWLCIPTSLTLFEWMRIETIYAQVYQIKCQRVENKNMPRGKKKSWVVKLLMGGGLSLVIILIIWFPMIFFAYSSALGFPSKPTQFGMIVQLNGHEAIYAMTVERNSLRSFTSEEYKNFKKLYDHSPQALDFIEEFDEEDIVIAKFRVDSSSSWRASPPIISRLIENLRNTSQVSIVTLTFEIIQMRLDIPLDLFLIVERQLSNKTCNRLADMLEGKVENGSAIIETILPKMLRLQNNGKILMLPNDLITNNFDEEGVYNNIKLTFFSEQAKWWQVKEDCDKVNNTGFYQLPMHECDEHVTVFLFNEKKFSDLLGGLAVKGVVGMYVTIIFVFSRFIRAVIVNFSTVNIIVEELPDVDKILNLIQNIYVVREAGEFLLEEDLVAKLYFLYRSPDILIRYTKPHEN